MLPVVPCHSLLHSCSACISTQVLWCLPGMPSHRLLVFSASARAQVSLDARDVMRAPLEVQKVLEGSILTWAGFTAATRSPQLLELTKWDFTGLLLACVCFRLLVYFVSVSVSHWYTISDAWASTCFFPMLRHWYQLLLCVYRICLPICQSVGVFSFDVFFVFHSISLSLCRQRMHACL